jgi:hypothetical protein
MALELGLTHVQMNALLLRFLKEGNKLPDVPHKICCGSELAKTFYSLFPNANSKTLFLIDGPDREGICTVRAIMPVPSSGNSTTDNPPIKIPSAQTAMAEPEEHPEPLGVSYSGTEKP